MNLITSDIFSVNLFHSNLQQKAVPSLREKSSLLPARYYVLMDCAGHKYL